MTIQKATPEQWQFAEDWGIYATRACLLELRARVEALEAQANHIGDINKMVPPPVATDDELQALWHELFSHDDSVSLGDVEVIARAVLERWGK
jgi:hypothetical protein